MELDKITFIKILHFTVGNFISCVKSYFSPEVLTTKKVFWEIVKRSPSITQALRNIAIHIKTNIESSGMFDVKELLNDKIQRLVQDVLLQDFIELAFNGEEGSFSISDSELHDFLHSGAMRDITSFTPSSLEMGGSFNFHIPLYSSINNVNQVSSIDSNFNCLLLSSQFENSRMQFEDELSELRRILENGFLVSDLNKFNVATILKYENNETASRMSMQQNELKFLQNSFVQNESLDPSTSIATESDLGILSDISEDSDFFLSWESCLGKFLPDHSYISEVTPEATLLHISEKQSQTYYSLLNPLDAISDEDMAHDILDLLIGIPSNTFFFDIHARKFRMKSGVHLPNLSSMCTLKIVEKFIEAGCIYYALQKFSKDFLHASEGLVFKGMQQGIQHILSLYKEYIVAVKGNFPTMLFLRSDVIKNAELLQSFGVICGIDPEKMIFNDIPKGLGLLSYLHNISRSHKRKENGIMIAVLLKYAYSPYFSFLNEWMTEGICNDPYGEFQIMEDFNYFGRRDAMYWKFAYTENIDDPARVVPPEIKHYSQGILDCGKSIGLLKICWPELSSLKFVSCKPLPSLSMVYSFPAAIHKLKDCMEYIILNENSDSISETSNESDDRFYIECQKLVNDTLMKRLLKRRYSIIHASMVTNSNILDVTKVSYHLKAYKSAVKKCDCLPVAVTNKDVLNGSLFRNIGPLFSSCDLKCVDKNISKEFICKSLPVHISCKLNKNDNFSGKLYKNIGILLSSCGYVESDVSDSLSNDIELNFTSLDFSKQLNLMTYSQFSFRSIYDQCKSLFKPEINYLDGFNNNNRMFQDISSIRKSESGFSENQDLCEDMLPSSLTYSKSYEDKENVNLVASGNQKKNMVLSSFMDKLASLLISEYEDSVDDVYSCIQVTSLQRLMMHNFNAVLKMRIHLIEKVIMKCIVKELGLDLLLSCLRNIYFFHDETFSQSLCEPLFSLVMKCKTPREFANWSVLNEMLVNAISNSNNENNPFLSSSVNVNITYIPEEMPVERTDFLHLFVIEFEVKWPLNIIVHQTCIQQYLKIFSTLLEIEFLCWLLGRIWRTLMITSKNLHLDDSPQFRQIMLKRFDMDQFIRVIRNSIHQHLQGPLWEFLKKNLAVDKSSIDALENIHMLYLEKALARCFLTDETHVLHQLLSTMCHQIYKFSSAISECIWEKNEETGHYETYAFRGLSAAFDTFKQYQNIFLKRIMKETLTKKCGRYWDKDYQDFLETISEIERNIR